MIISEVNIWLYEADVIVPWVLFTKKARKRDNNTVIWLPIEYFYKP